jgi:hypothetical protein
MKSFFLIIVFLILMANSHATEAKLSTDFLDSEDIQFWILDTAQ